jgi:hypothetical protein
MVLTHVDMEGVVLPLVLADNLSGYVEEWKFTQLWRRQWWWWQQNAVRQVCTPSTNRKEGQFAKEVWLRSSWVHQW